MTIHNIQGYFYFLARKRFPISFFFFFFYEGVKLPAATGGDIYDFYINESHYLVTRVASAVYPQEQGTMNRIALQCVLKCIALLCLEVFCTVLHCTLIAL